MGSIDIDQLRSAIESARTLTSIAAELGVSRPTISRAAKAAGIAVPRRPPPITRRRPHPKLDDPDWLAAAYADRTMTDIAKDLDVSVSTVSAALQRHGIPRRNNRDARTLARPEQLHDADWLRARYEHSTAAEIGDELGVNPQRVYAAMRDHGIERRYASTKQRLRNPPELDDPDWLRQRCNEVSAPVIADELGVVRRTVYPPSNDTASTSPGPRGSTTATSGSPHSMSLAGLTSRSASAISGRAEGLARRSSTLAGTAATDGQPSKGGSTARPVVVMLRDRPWTRCRRRRLGGRRRRGRSRGPDQPRDYQDFVKMFIQPRPQIPGARLGT